MSAAKILVVDDEPSLLFFMEKALSRDGYEVVTVTTGEAALEAAAHQEFDLALIDLNLGRIGGMEVLATLRRRWPDMVVIVLTAYASLETSVEALRQGAHDYLFKPCKTVELRESIRRGLLDRQQKLRQRNLLRQLKRLVDSVEEGEPADLETLPVEVEGSKPANPSPRFRQLNGLIIDFLQHVVTLDGHLLECSPTEFDLLAYLISESPRVVSPQELMREVQGHSAEPWAASDTMRYHIYNIRQKIKKVSGRTDIIETVRGVGYKIG